MAPELTVALVTVAVILVIMVVVTLLWIVGLLVLRRRRWLRVTVAASDTGGASAIVADGTMTVRINRALRAYFASS